MHPRDDLSCYAGKDRFRLACNSSRAGDRGRPLVEGEPLPSVIERGVIVVDEDSRANEDERATHNPDRIDVIDPERLYTAYDEALQLISERLPQRVYPSTKIWRVTATAWVARMAGTLGTMRLLIQSGHRSDAMTLLRSLWEHVVTFCWYMIDPERRLSPLTDHSLAGQRTVHEEVAEYGVTVLSADELARTQGKKRLPTLIPLAAEVDEYWGPRIKGFRVQPATGSRDLLTLSGLYIGLYRIASRSAHPSIEGLGGCIDFRGRLPSVRLEDDGDSYPFGMALPVFALALLVSHRVMGWPPDENAIRSLADALSEAEDATT